MLCFEKEANEVNSEIAFCFMEYNKAFLNIDLVTFIIKSINQSINQVDLNLPTMNILHSRFPILHVIFHFLYTPTCVLQ